MEFGLHVLYVVSVLARPQAELAPNATFGHPHPRCACVIARAPKVTLLISYYNFVNLL